MIFELISRFDIMEDLSLILPKWINWGIKNILNNLILQRKDLIRRGPEQDNKIGYYELSTVKKESNFKSS